MRKLISSAFVVAALATTIAIAPASALAQQPAPSLDQIMSAEERAAAGIAKLTPAERAAFEAWLGRYTATVRGVVRMLDAPTTPGQAAVPSTPADVAAPPATPAPSATPPTLPSTAPLGAHVFRSADGGTFIMLRDGTVWEIFYSDRPVTTVWQAGDFVQVRRSPLRVGRFDYQLVNADRDRKVAARFAGFVKIEEPAAGGPSR